MSLKLLRVSVRGVSRSAPSRSLTVARRLCNANPFGGMAGMFGGAGGNEFGGMMKDDNAKAAMWQIMMDAAKDPALQKLMMKPNVMKALMEIKEDQQKLADYCDDPDVAMLFMKLAVLSLKQGGAKAPSDASQIPAGVPDAQIDSDKK